MTQGQLLDLLREALWAALIVALPVLAVALAIGLVIGLVQALTSIQEMTLTFVPKLAGILTVFWITMDFSGRVLLVFWDESILPAIVGS